MNTETEKEEPTVLRKPLRHLEYDILVFFCVGINFALMIVSYMIFGPKSFDTTKVLWFHVSILAFVPTLGTFFICLLVSTKTQHILVSPVYVTFFTAIPALILGVYVQYAMNYSLLEVERMNSVFAYLLVGVFAYFIWFYLSGSLSQPIIRNLVGAYAERGNVKSGTTIYQTSDVERILEKMEDKKWLSDLCSLRIVERKEDKNEIRLKLNKHNTDFFLSVYGRKLESESYVALTHYELFENLVEKTIMVNDDSRVCLRPQIVELEESLELKPVSVKKSQILYHALNYAMAPARFPMLLKYRNQIIIVSVTSIAAGLIGLSRFTGVIDNETFLSFLAIAVALGSAAFTMINRK